MILYDILKPLEENLRIAYQQGGRVSSGLFRDLEIYEEYQTMKEPKMLRYSILSEKHKISETLVRWTVKKMQTIIKEPHRKPIYEKDNR